MKAEDAKGSEDAQGAGAEMLLQHVRRHATRA
jgi:hypothetical protein